VSGGLGEPLIRTALVLAAGRGTRIRSIALDVPKPLIAVAGRTVLERNLDQLAEAGVRDVWINLHYRGEQIAARIGDGDRYGLRVRYSWESELLGTAGAAKKLESSLGVGTFLVISSDTLTALDLDAMVARHRQRSAMATIAVFDRNRVPNTGLAGGRVVIDDAGRVVRFEEGTAHEESFSSPYVNTSVYVLEPEILDLMPANTFYDFGHDVFPSLLRLGARFDAYPIVRYCLGIDTPEALMRAEAFVREREAGDLILAGCEAPSGAEVAR